MDDLALALRTGLPDALRVLVERYPRTGWEAHPQFNALIRFWLDRHLMFRGLQASLLSETEAFLDDRREARAYGAGLARTAGLFLNELHAHHGIEDAQYFPALRLQDPRLEAGFDLLDADHHALDGHLHGLAETAGAVLRSLQTDPVPRDPAARLHGTLAGFGRFLDRHLADEEELVVPVILAYRGGGVS